MRRMSNFIITIISRLIGAWFLPPTTFDPYSYILPIFSPPFRLHSVVSASIRCQRRNFKQISA